MVFRVHPFVGFKIFEWLDFEFIWQFLKVKILQYCVSLLEIVMMVLRNESEFTLLENNGANRLYLNTEREILKVCWHDKVSLHATQEIWNCIRKIIDEGKAKTLILDLTHFNEFEPKAISWFRKQFVKSQIKRLMEVVNRVAVINSETRTEKVFRIIRGWKLKLLYPQLRIGYFDSFDCAQNWLLEECEPD